MAGASIDIGVVMHGFGFANESLGILRQSFERVAASTDNLEASAKRFSATQGNISRLSSNLSSTLQNSTSTIQDFNDKINKSDHFFDNLTEAVARGEQEQADYERTLREVNKSLLDLGVTFSTIAGTHLRALTQALLQSSIQMEQFQLMLRATGGSADIAASQMQRLIKMADAPGLEFQGLVQGVASLQATGVSAELAEKSVSEIGNALAAIGAPASELSGVVRAFSQIQAKGRVYAEEVQQIAERMPQIRTILQDTFGTGRTEEIQRMGLSANEFLELLVDGMSNLSRVGETTQNTIKNFNNQLFLLGSELGEVILPVFSDLVKGLTNTVKWFRELPKGIKSTIAWVTSISGIVLTFSAILGTVVTTIGFLIQGLKQYSIASATAAAAANVQAAAVGVLNSQLALQNALSRGSKTPIIDSRFGDVSKANQELQKMQGNLNKVTASTTAVSVASGFWSKIIPILTKAAKIFGLFAVVATVAYTAISKMLKITRDSYHSLNDLSRGIDSVGNKTFDVLNAQYKKDGFLDAINNRNEALREELKLLDETKNKSFGSMRFKGLTQESEETTELFEEKLRKRGIRSEIDLSTGQRRYQQKITPTWQYLGSRIASPMASENPIIGLKWWTNLFTKKLLQPKVDKQPDGYLKEQGQNILKNQYDQADQEYVDALRNKDPNFKAIVIEVPAPILTYAEDTVGGGRTHKFKLDTIKKFRETMSEGMDMVNRFVKDEFGKSKSFLSTDLSGVDFNVDVGLLTVDQAKLLAESVQKSVKQRQEVSKKLGEIKVDRQGGLVDNRSIAFLSTLRANLEERVVDEEGNLGIVFVERDKIIKAVETIKQQANRQQGIIAELFSSRNEFGGLEKEIEHSIKNSDFQKAFKELFKIEKATEDDNSLLGFVFTFIENIDGKQVVLRKSPEEFLQLLNTKIEQLERSSKPEDQRNKRGFIQVRNKINFYIEKFQQSYSQNVEATTASLLQTLFILDSLGLDWAEKAEMLAAGAEKKTSPDYITKAGLRLKDFIDAVELQVDQLNNSFNVTGLKIGTTEVPTVASLLESGASFDQIDLARELAQQEQAIQTKELEEKGKIAKALAEILNGARQDPLLSPVVRYLSERLFPKDVPQLNLMNQENLKAVRDVLKAWTGGQFVTSDTTPDNINTYQSNLTKLFGDDGFEYTTDQFIDDFFKKPEEKGKGRDIPLAGTLIKRFEAAINLFPYTQLLRLDNQKKNIFKEGLKKSAIELEEAQVSFDEQRANVMLMGHAEIRRNFEIDKALSEEMKDYRQQQFLISKGAGTTVQDIDPNKLSNTERREYDLIEKKARIEQKQIAEKKRRFEIDVKNGLELARIGREEEISQEKNRLYYEDERNNLEIIEHQRNKIIETIKLEIEEKRASLQLSIATIQAQLNSLDLSVEDRLEKERQIENLQKLFVLTGQELRIRLSGERISYQLKLREFELEEKRLKQAIKFRNETEKINTIYEGMDSGEFVPFPTLTIPKINFDIDSFDSKLSLWFRQDLNNLDEGLDEVIEKERKVKTTIEGLNTQEIQKSVLKISQSAQDGIDKVLNRDNLVNFLVDLIPVSSIHPERSMEKVWQNMVDNFKKTTLKSIGDETNTFASISDLVDYTFSNKDRKYIDNYVAELLSFVEQAGESFNVKPDATKFVSKGIKSKLDNLFNLNNIYSQNVDLKDFISGKPIKNSVPTDGLRSALIYALSISLEDLDLPSERDLSKYAGVTSTSSEDYVESYRKKLEPVVDQLIPYIQQSLGGININDILASTLQGMSSLETAISNVNQKFKKIKIDDKQREFDDFHTTLTKITDSSTGLEFMKNYSTPVKKQLSDAIDDPSYTDVKVELVEIKKELDSIHDRVVNIADVKLNEDWKTTISNYNKNLESHLNSILKAPSRETFYSAEDGVERSLLNLRAEYNNTFANLQMDYDDAISAGDDSAKKRAIYNLEQAKQQFSSGISSLKSQTNQANLQFEQTFNEQQIRINNINEMKSRSDYTSLFDFKQRIDLEDRALKDSYRLQIQLLEEKAKKQKGNETELLAISQQRTLLEQQLQADLIRAYRNHWKETITIAKDGFVSLWDNAKSYKESREDELDDYKDKIEDINKDLNDSLSDLASDSNKTFREKEEERLKIAKDYSKRREDIEKEHNDTMKDLRNEFWKDLLSSARRNISERLANKTIDWTIEKFTFNDKESIDKLFEGIERQKLPGELQQQYDELVESRKSIADTFENSGGIFESLKRNFFSSEDSTVENGNETTANEKTVEKQTKNFVEAVSNLKTSSVNTMHVATMSVKNIEGLVGNNQRTQKIEDESKLINSLPPTAEPILPTTDVPTINNGSNNDSSSEETKTESTSGRLADAFKHMNPAEANPYALMAMHLGTTYASDRMLEKQETTKEREKYAKLQFAAGATLATIGSALAFFDPTKKIAPYLVGQGLSMSTNSMKETGWFDTRDNDIILQSMARRAGHTQRSAEDMSRLVVDGFKEGYEQQQDGSGNVEVNVSGHFELGQRELQYIADETHIMRKRGVIG